MAKNIVMDRHAGKIGIISIVDGDHKHAKYQNNRRCVAMQRTYIGDHPKMSKISSKPKSLSTIICSFKSIVTKAINQKFPCADFAWQSRFHDHIIVNENELNHIREYIFQNPLKYDLENEAPDFLSQNK